MKNLLKSTDVHLVFSEEAANILVEEAKERGNLEEHNIKQKNKHGKEYWVVKIVEVMDTERAIMDQFKEQ